MTLDLQPPEPWESEFLYLNHPVCGIFLWQPRLPNASSHSALPSSVRPLLGMTAAWVSSVCCSNAKSKAQEWQCGRELMLLQALMIQQKSWDLLKLIQKLGANVCSSKCQHQTIWTLLWLSQSPTCNRPSLTAPAARESPEKSRDLLFATLDTIVLLLPPYTQAP